MLWQLFYTFLKIGAFTFGSGYAMIPMIEREVIDRKKWFERDEFMEQFILAQSAPGPFSLNTAVFVGYKLKGWIGSVVAVIGLVIPSFVIILLIAIYFTDFRSNPTVEAAFQGIRPAIVALIAVPFVNFLREMVWWQILIALTIAVLVWQLGLSPIYLLILGALIGVLTVYFKKK